MISGYQQTRLLACDGWQPYYNAWIKGDWITSNLPYDRMATTLEGAWQIFKKEHDADLYPSEELFIKAMFNKWII